ncbi:MAG: aminotransferase class III-fold pyridoxal phosphate-dependent enzyme [Gammaproteobacteria bacterium]
MNTQLTVPENARAAEARHLVQVYAQLGIEPVSAAGVHIQCRDRQILDLYGGHAVAGLGYAHPAILQTLNEQAELLMFQSNVVALEVRARAADKLAAFAPTGLDHVFFVNTGAEANENALRIALKHTGRDRILAIEHGFHGRSAAAGAVTWGAAQKWYGFPRTPFDVAFIGRNDSTAAQEMINGDTAAVIVELVQGMAGAYELGREFAETLAGRCAETGALLIVDEVQSGMGRSGHPFAADAYQIKPDLLTVAKSLGAGFPCGAVLMTSEIAAKLGTGDLGTTFGGGPLACALIETVIDEIIGSDLMENVRAVSAALVNALPAGPVKSAQGMGFLIGLRCSAPAKLVRDGLLERGILVGTSADPAVIRLIPPLVLDQPHIEELIDALIDMG